MVIGIGIDIVNIERIERMIVRYGDRFLDRIFTKSEKEYCSGKIMKYESFAARFSAKEAALKAIGTGWRYGIRFADIEVTHDPLGKPEINVYGKAKEWVESELVSKIHVSLSHLSEMATAVVVIEKKGD